MLQSIMMIYLKKWQSDTGKILVTESGNCNLNKNCGSANFGINRRTIKFNKIKYHLISIIVLYVVKV